jgi:hypothetical protein
MRIKCEPKKFEEQIIKMCDDLTYFVENHATMDEAWSAQRLRDELSEFHNVTLKPLIDEVRRMDRRKFP